MNRDLDVATGTGHEVKSLDRKDTAFIGPACGCDNFDPFGTVVVIEYGRDVVAFTDVDLDRTVQVRRIAGFDVETEDESRKHHRRCTVTRHVAFDLGEVNDNKSVDAGNRIEDHGHAGKFDCHRIGTVTVSTALGIATVIGFE